jgi:hypothetical protein
VLDEYDFEQDGIYDMLRKNIAQLSVCYRDIIIMSYYDNMTSGEIAAKLNIPEGTVRYRLSVGRNKLKKEINIMQETALKPVKLNMRTNGSYNGTPWMYLNDALSQNILWQAYWEAKSVEELSKILGVPAYYCEKIINNEIINENEKEFAATAIKDGFLKKSGGKLEFDTPYFPIEQYERFRGFLPEKEDIMPLIQKQVKKYADGYKKLFPSHLKEEAGSITFHCLVRKSIGEWAAESKIKIPPESVCSVLVEHNGGMFFNSDMKAVDQ